MNSRFLTLIFASIFLVAVTPDSYAGPRHRPANPRGVADPRGALDPRGVRDPRGIADPRGVRDPRGIADPRGVLDPRGVADPRGVFDPRGPFDPRNPARYMYGLPAGYAARVYAGVRYYYCGGVYYYPYIINGRTVYTLAPLVNGIPTMPPRPY